MLRVCTIFDVWESKSFSRIKIFRKTSRWSQTSVTIKSSVILSMLRFPKIRLVGVIQQWQNFGRMFSGSSIMLAPNDKKKREQVKESKKKEKRMQLLKLRHKQNPELHPLYMDIPRALKYLRAAEVGYPASLTTLSLQVTVIPERGSKPLSGSVFLPHPLKQGSMLVFSLNEEALEQAKKKGASKTGGTSLIKEIQAGEVKLDDFTHSFATPDIMSELGPIARILGPRNLMPSPKKGTVSENIAALIEGNLGSLPFKQKERHLAIPIGRCDFTDKQILENIKAASDAIYDSQPVGTKKPNLIGQACLSSTFGPSIVINIRK